MWFRIMIYSSAILISSQIFAAPEIIFRCDTTPKGFIEVSRDKTTYKFNIYKNGKNILNYMKDFKKNTEKNFLRFNYSYGDSATTIGFVFMDDGHWIYMDEYFSNFTGYSIDGVRVLECNRNEIYINRLRELDRQKSLPAFSYD